MKTVTTLGSLLLMALLAGCGRASEAAAPTSGAPPAVPAAEAPSSASAVEAEADEAEPTTLAEAEALLEKARADLDRLALNESAPGGSVEAAPPPSPASAGAPRRQNEEKRAEQAAADHAPAPKKDANPCETACKAFSSLERASEAVCRLDAEAGGKRCERARQIREDAARRVASCACSK
jgi:hypothetical protein